MAGQDRFERLWKQKLFALQDRDGIYQYGGFGRRQREGGNMTNATAVEAVIFDMDGES